MKLKHVDEILANVKHQRFKSDRDLYLIAYLNSSDWKNN
jgi:hypothetical protein